MRVGSSSPVRKTAAAALGLISAPLASAIMLTAYTILVDQTDVTGNWFPLAVIYYSAAAVVTLFVGLPIFLVLVRFDLVRAWSAILAGTIIGALVALGIGFDSIGIAGVLVMAASGAASALTLWLIWGLAQDKHAAAGT